MNRTTLVFNFDDDPTGEQQPPTAVIYKGSRHVLMQVRKGEEVELANGNTVTSIMVSAHAIERLAEVADGEIGGAPDWMHR